MDENPQNQTDDIAHQEVTAENVAELLAPAADISNIETMDGVEEAAFELYKETAILVAVIANLYEGDVPAEMALDRNRAVCAGLLVRIAKFMMAVIQLTAKDRRGEVVLVLNRCILESAINLEFLVTQNSDQLFDRFVKNSLGPERELYDVIQTNIRARNGQVLAIEDRMLTSVERVFRLSGVKFDEVQPKYSEWGQNFRERLKALDKEYMYLFLQRIPSHAVHGSWIDILLHHVDGDVETGKFSPHPEWARADARLLLPIATLLLETVGAYVTRYFPEPDRLQLIKDRISDLSARIHSIDELHERLMNAN